MGSKKRVDSSMGPKCEGKKSLMPKKKGCHEKKKRGRQGAHIINQKRDVKKQMVRTKKRLFAQNFF